MPAIMGVNNPSMYTMIPIKSGTSDGENGLYRNEKGRGDREWMSFVGGTRPAGYGEGGPRWPHLKCDATVSRKEGAKK